MNVVLGNCDQKHVPGAPRRRAPDAAQCSALATLHRRKVVCLGAILLFLFSTVSTPAQQGPPDVIDLVRQKEYLELERVLQSRTHLPAADRIFAEGVLANRRNRVHKSIRLLQPMISSVDKDAAIIALSTLADDYEKTFQYARAADAYSELDQQFGQYMSAAERSHVRTEAARWNLLRGAPPQTVMVGHPFTIQTTRDAVGLIETTIAINGQSIPVIVDSGANLCALRRSTAERLGLPISSAHATSRGIAGDVISVHATIIPELRFGDAIAKNVAAIVVDDRDLNVEKFHYRIPGSLGFPVLSALGRITFLAGGDLAIDPDGIPATKKVRNLFLERLTPVVAARVGGSSHLFTIDTGATGAFLSLRYYREHKAEFARRRVEHLDLEGAGGAQSIPAYLMSSVNIRFGGGCVTINDLPVLTQARNLSDDHFYGNFGQSVLRETLSYTFDFKKMAFSVDGSACTALP